ncbi:MAG: rod shape-determining protein MreC [Cytophagaceae bacterium]|jgi:rod shape-determining protein MreC|nr:rod shape-determining protein MreC [Cytophagaceae bacterium]
MFRLLEFIYAIRVFLVFVAIEIVCIWMLVRFNPYHGAAYFSTSSSIAGSVLSIQRGITEYFGLRKTNLELAEENAQLKAALYRAQQRSTKEIDTSIVFIQENKFDVKVARVINNNTSLANNFFTLNKGARQGVEVGMGVLSSKGVAGQIKSVTDHYATAISILNAKWSISAKVLRMDADGIIKWEDDTDPLHVSFTDVAKHHKVKVGDTVVTSGYKQVLFPKGIPIGIVSEVKDEGGSFWNIKVRLTTDFTAMDYVFITKNNLKVEQDSVEAEFTKEKVKP